jgi:hypothetical protein
MGKSPQQTPYASRDCPRVSDYRKIDLTMLLLGQPRDIPCALEIRESDFGDDALRLPQFTRTIILF